MQHMDLGQGKKCQECSPWNWTQEKNVCVSGNILEKKIE
jgi:hypothetical protein